MKYKKHTAIILLIMICFSFAMPLTAVATDTEIVDKGNPFQRAVAGLLDFFNQMLVSMWDAVGFKSLSELVFSTGLSEAEKDALPWQMGQVPYVYKFYMGLLIATMPIYLILIAISAFKFLSASVNPKERAEAKESVMRLFYGLLLMLLAPYLIKILMQTSLFLVDAIAHAYRNIGDIQGLNSLSVDILAGDGIQTGSVLGTVLVKIAFGLLFLYFNILYIIRMISISVMFIFTPVMSMVWVINKNALAVAVWLGELVANAFMPVSHAIVLCVILMLTDVGNVTDGSFVTVIIALWILVPLSETIRKSLQSIISRIAGFDAEGSAKGILGIAAGSIMTVGRATFSGQKTTTKGPSPKDPKGKPPQKAQPPSRRPVNTTQSGGYQSVGAKEYKVQQSGATGSTSSGTSTGTARVYATNRPATVTKTPSIHTADKAGQIARAATTIAAIPANIVGAAIPGGKPIIEAGTKLAGVTAHKATTAIVAGGQVAMAYAKSGNLGKSLQKVTGTTDAKQAVARVFSPDKATQYKVPQKMGGVQRLAGKKYKLKEVQAIKIPPQQTQESTLNKNQRWRSKPITEKQVFTLRKLGRSAEGLDRGSASDIIGSYLEGDRYKRIP